MLVLSRFAGENIVIGDNIRIKILSVEKGKVKIGIEAEKSTPVHREEVYLGIVEEKERRKEEKNKSSGSLKFCS